MRPLAFLSCLCAAIALLTGCSAIHAARQSFMDSFHTSFRSSFKTGFLKSCTRQGNSEELCTCVETKFAAGKTDDELMTAPVNGDASRKMLRDAAKACAASK